MHHQPPSHARPKPSRRRSQSQPLARPVALLLTLFAAPSPNPSIGQSPTLEPRQSLLAHGDVIELDYQVDESALPLDRVDFWYTLDQSQTWHYAGADDDRHPPAVFRAPREGLFGFFFVIANAAGSSSPPPEPGAQPHARVFVDVSAPIVQLHPLRIVPTLGGPALQIRWSAVDANFGPRPVQLLVQRPPDPNWTPITPDPIANTGLFDWRFPPELTGPVGVRIVVTDLGDHRVETERQVIEIPPPAPPPARLAKFNPPARDSTRTETDPRRDELAASPIIGQALPPELNHRTAQLFAEAMSLKQAKDYRQGVARMREVVKIDPQRADAFAELGDMLARLDDPDRARDAFNVALQLQPSMRTALLGSAALYRRNRDYPSAVEQLRALLRHRPKDAEAWLNLGDLAVFQGDELLARECYTRAADIDPAATQTIADAKQRLAMLNQGEKLMPVGR